MPYFKDQNGGLHFLEDAAFSTLLPQGCAAITDAEAAQLQAAPPPSVAEIIASYTDAIQKRLDDFARTRGYDDMKSLVGYAGDPFPQFALEGDYGKAARSATWVAARDILAAVEAGEREAPTLEALAAELPALAWPGA